MIEYPVKVSPGGSKTYVKAMSLKFEGDGIVYRTKRSLDLAIEAVCVPVLPAAVTSNKRASRACLPVRIQMIIAMSRA